MKICGKVHRDGKGGQRTSIRHKPPEHRIRVTRRCVFASMIFLLLSGLLLSACSKKEPTKNPQDVLSEAQATADALIRTSAATNTPTKPPATPTFTPNPSATPTSVGSILPTQPVGSAADKVEFVSDVTVPDGTTFAPNAGFVKTWRLKNAGTTTWSTAYTVVYISGEPMGAPASVALPSAVPPGSTVDVSVNMVSPATEGTYTTNFMLVNASGQRFGLDPGGSQPFYVVIVVEAGGTPAASATAMTVTPTVTTTPGTGGAIVTWAFLSVDNPTASSCPHTFNFTGLITLASPAIVTYRLEVLSNDPNNPVASPDPVTQSLPAGQVNVPFTLNLSSPFSGVVRLHVTAPEDVPSNGVNLYLTCAYPTP